MTIIFVLLFNICFTKHSGNQNKEQKLCSREKLKKQ